MTRMTSSAAAMSDDTSVVSPTLVMLSELRDQFQSVQANWSTRMLVPRREASNSVGVLARFHRPLPTGCTEYDTWKSNQSLALIILNQYIHSSGDLEEPSDCWVQLEERVDAEDETVHAGYLTHGAQLVHLVGEFGVQGNTLDHFITRVWILSILSKKNKKKQQHQISLSHFFFFVLFYG